jgi:aspartyl-tRNA(Asn)/glutamyl-tRNA(Gln) amidotransferase subunit B
MWSSGKSAGAIIEEKGLRQNSDEGEIAKLIEEVLNANQTQLSQYLGGNERLFPFFVGQCMKATKGMANPTVVNRLLQEALKRRVAG